ncbi:MAG: cache domain-containing protein, partial [Pseudodesulfovibrio sp.]|nr:cache domain-containing protein [Pseudodesulfovibrio sp.]
MTKDKRSLRAIFLRHMIILAVASLVAWTLVLVHNDYTSFKDGSMLIRQRHIDAQKELLVRQVQEVTKYINYMENLTEKRLKNSLRERVNEAHQIASGIYDKYSGTEEPEKVRKMIKEALRPIRFNQGRGYYFAFNLDGIEELFADRPELEGTNMLPMQSADGKFVVQDMLSICREKGEGFYTYLWTKPGLQSENFPKIAYVKLFEPYGWVIGTGEYLDDTGKIIQDEVLDRIKDLRFEPEGYFFGSTYEGEPLFSNGKITMGTGSIQDLTDPNGVKIIREYQKAAMRDGGGFINYSWRKIEEAAPSPKMSYVLSIPKWEWIIGAGVYLDTIETIITQNEEALFAELKQKILKSVAVLMLLLGVVFFWSRYISKNIQATVESLTRFFKKAATESVSIDVDELHFAEFKDIARQINFMLVERKQGEEELRESEIKWRSYVENAPYGIFVANREGRYVEANPAASRITGYAKAELLEKMIPDLIAPQSRESALNNFENLVNTGASVGESAFLHKSGEIRYWTVWAIRLNDDRFLGFVEDITERKQARELISKTNSLLTAVINQAPFAIHILEGEPNNMTMVIENKESARIMGEVIEGRKGMDADVPETLGTRFFSLDGKHEIPLNQMPSPRAFKGEVVTNEEFLFRHADGTELLVEASASLIYDANHQIIAVCVTFQDITEQKKAEKE